MHETYLELAGNALSRRDYLSAMSYGLRAAGSPRARDAALCDAYRLLALATLELDMPETALAYAVGAHLAACRARDPHREEQAAAVVGLVVARHPNLGDAHPKDLHH